MVSETTTPLPDHKTRIVATIGPASERQETIERLILAGMNVARLNFSHGDFEGHGRVIERIRAASAATNRPVAIMADLPGPKLRIGRLESEPIILTTGARFVLTTEELIGGPDRVSVSFPRLTKVVRPGDTLFLNDGYVQLEVTAIGRDSVDCVVKVGGELRSRNGLSLPGIDLGMGAFTERDRECLAFALRHGVDAVSQSFVESAADVRAVREAARELGHDPYLVAKIERARAVHHIGEILEAADGIMIARGDLGVEMPIETIAVVQKKLMRRANQYGKPVITATQMLESMTRNPRPTRAEVTDVSNAILDGTDCVMLSGESALGGYPVESVEMLARIAAVVEPTRPTVSVREMFAGVDFEKRILPEHLIAISVEASLEYLKPAAIFSLAERGLMAARLASFHLPTWIVAVGSTGKTCQDLLFSYGVIPVREPSPPAVWNSYVKEWIGRHEAPGGFAILIERPSSDDPESNHRMEIIEL
jgi:pyruvate kinase